jgi:hypothetical protein
MRVDQHAEHAERLVVLDEAHPSHVGGEIVDFAGARDRLLACFPPPEVELQVLRLGEALMPLLQRFDIDRADAKAVREETSSEVAADEAAGAADDCGVCGHVSHTDAAP